MAMLHPAYLCGCVSQVLCSLPLYQAVAAVCAQSVLVKWCGEHKPVEVSSVAFWPGSEGAWVVDLSAPVHADDSLPS